MDSDAVFYIVMGVAALVTLYIITQRWFWGLAFFLAALAAAFSCIASIIHFQILWAVGYFVLAFILWVFFLATAGKG